jgi:hypothetical protein
MGRFLVNVHVQVDDLEALTEEMRRMADGACWVTPAKNGWSSVYEEQASSQDDAWIRELTARLSDQLQTGAIAFLVHDSDVFCYWLYDRGELIDEFNSCPDYFGGEESFEVSDDSEFGGDDSDGSDSGSGDPRGRPEIVARYCHPARRPQEIEGVLASKETFAESQLEKLAALLGIDAARAMTDSQDLEGEQDPEEIGAIPVGR